MDSRASGQARWDEAMARDVLAAWRKSGESARVFGRGHGIDPQRLHWWRNKLERDRRAARARRRPRATAIAFVPAVVAGAADGAGASAAVVVQIGAVRVEIADTARVAPSWIAAVIGALDAPR